MGDTRVYLGVDGDWNNTSNWTDGDVPDNTDTVIIADSDKNITTNMDQSAVHSLNIYVLEGFTGTIGTPASPLHTGTNTSIFMNAPRCGGCNIYPDSGTNAIIYQTMNTAYGFHFANGTLTNVHAVGGRGIRMGASATVTTLYGHRQDAVVHIEDGFTITTLANHFATIQSYENTMTTLNNYAGQVWFRGDVAGTLGTLNNYGGTFYGNAPNLTVTKVNGYGGLVDFSQDGGIKTITNADCWTGCTLNLHNGGAIVLSNAPVRYGGTIITDQTVTNTIPDFFPGAGVGA